MRHRLKKVVSALALGTAAVWIITGCMSETVEPNTPASMANARQAGAMSDGSGLLGGGGGLLGSILNPLVKLVFQVVKLAAGQAGSVSNGRWRLDVPAGAINGDATVGIGVQSSTAFSCQLEILPAELNHFSTPVTVTANCREIDKDKLKDWVIWWFDPMQNKWVRLENSKVDLTRGTVSAPLPHCSAYAAGPRDGKAGW